MAPGRDRSEAAAAVEAQIAWELGHYYMDVLDDAERARQWWEVCQQGLPASLSSPPSKRARTTIDDAGAPPPLW